MTHAEPQQEEGVGRRFRKGLERMNNVSADIFKVVSLMEPNQKRFIMTELSCAVTITKGRMLLIKREAAFILKLLSPVILKTVN